MTSTKASENGVHTLETELGNQERESRVPIARYA